MRRASGTRPRKYAAISERPTTWWSGRCIHALTTAVAAPVAPSSTSHGNCAGGGAGQVTTAVGATRR